MSETSLTPNNNIIDVNVPGSSSLKGGIFFGANLIPNSDFQNTPNYVTAPANIANSTPTLVYTLSKLKAELQNQASAANSSNNSSNSSLLSESTLNTFLAQVTQLLIDYSDMRNFIFYGSAYTELNYFIQQTITNFPFQSYIARDININTPLNITYLSGNRTQITFAFNDIQEGTVLGFYESSNQWTNFEFVDNFGNNFPVLGIISPYNPISNISFVAAPGGYTVNVTTTNAHNFTSTSLVDVFITDNNGNVRIQNTYTVIVTGSNTYTIDSIFTSAVNFNNITRGTRTYINLVNNNTFATGSLIRFGNVPSISQLAGNQFMVNVISNQIIEILDLSGNPIDSNTWNPLGYIQPLIYQSFVAPATFTFSTGYTRISPVYQPTLAYTGNFNISFIVQGIINTNNFVQNSVINNSSITSFTPPNQLFQGLYLAPNLSIITNFYANAQPEQLGLLYSNPSPWPRENLTKNIIISGSNFDLWVESSNNMTTADVGDIGVIQIPNDQGLNLISALGLDEEYTNQIVRRCIPIQLIDETTDPSGYFTVLSSLAGKMFDTIHFYIQFLKYVKSLNYTNYNQLSPQFYETYADHFGFELVRDNLFNSVQEALNPGSTFNTQNAYDTQIKTLLLNLNYLYGAKGTQAAIVYLVGALGFPKDLFVVEEFYLQSLNQDANGYAPATKDCTLDYEYNKDIQNDKVFVPNYTFEIDPWYTTINYQFSLSIDPSKFSLLNPYIYFNSENAEQKYIYFNDEFHEPNWVQQYTNYFGIDTENPTDKTLPYTNWFQVAVQNPSFLSINNVNIKNGALYYTDNTGYSVLQSTDINWVNFFNSLSIGNSINIEGTSFPNYLGVFQVVNKTVISGAYTIEINCPYVYDDNGIVQNNITVIGSSGNLTYPQNINDASTAFVNNVNLLTSSTGVSAVYLNGEILLDFPRSQKGWNVIVSGDISLLYNADLKVMPVYSNISYRYRLSNEDDFNLRECNLLFDPQNAIFEDIVFKNDYNYDYCYLAPRNYANLQSLGLSSGYRVLPLALPDKYYGFGIRYMIPKDGYYNVTSENSKTNLTQIDLCSIYEIADIVLTSPNVLQPLTTSYSYPTPGVKNVAIIKFGTFSSGNIQIKTLDTSFVSHNISNIIPFNSTVTQTLTDIVTDINTNGFGYSAMLVPGQSIIYIYSPLFVNTNGWTIGSSGTIVGTEYDNFSNVDPSLVYDTQRSFVITRIEDNNLVVRARFNNEIESGIITQERIAIAPGIFDNDGLLHMLKINLRPYGIEVYQDNNIIGIYEWINTLPNYAISVNSRYILSLIENNTANYEPFVSYTNSSEQLFAPETRTTYDVTRWWDLFVGNPFGMKCYFNQVDVFELLSINYNNPILLNSDGNFNQECEIYSFDFSNNVSGGNTIIDCPVDFRQFESNIPVVIDKDYNIQTSDLPTVRLQNKLYNSSNNNYDLDAQLLEIPNDFLYVNKLQAISKDSVFEYNSWSETWDTDYEYNDLNKILQNYYDIFNNTADFYDILAYIINVDSRYETLIETFLPILVNVNYFGMLISNSILNSKKNRYIDIYKSDTFNVIGNNAIAYFEILDDGGISDRLNSLLLNNTSLNLFSAPIAYNTNAVITASSIVTNINTNIHYPNIQAIQTTGIENNMPVYGRRVQILINTDWYNTTFGLDVNDEMLVLSGTYTPQDWIIGYPQPPLFNTPSVIEIDTDTVLTPFWKGQSMLQFSGGIPSVVNNDGNFSISYVNVLDTRVNS